MAAPKLFLEQLKATHCRESRPSEQWKDFTVAWLDLRRLKLGLGVFVPMIWLDGDTRRSASEAAEEAMEFARQRPGSGPMIVLADDTFRSALDPEAFKVFSLAVLSPAVRTAFIEARDAERRYKTLGAALAADVGPSGLTPYVPGKPASGPRFFGRTRVLEQIFSGKIVRNCTIVGNRRIGKTSLLHEIKERLCDIYIKNQNVHFAELYASKFKSTWDAVYSTLTQLGIQVPKAWTKLGAIAPRYINRFPQLIHDFARQRQTYVIILIDEFDWFLEIDSQNNWEFLHLLREVAGADEGSCAVVVAGYRLLMQTRIRRDNPYYNFTKEIEVVPLGQEETLDMVQTPLGRLGIDVAHTNIPTVIHKETRGQPELIQMYCQAVIALYERRRTVPDDGELTRLVNRDQAFSRTILHTFLRNANPIEQAVCFQLMKRAGDEGASSFEFRVRDVEEALTALNLQVGNAEMVTLLNNLVVGSFIERPTGAPGRFRFAVPQLVRYCHAVGLDQMLTSALNQTRAGKVSFDTLSVDPHVEE